MSLTLNEKLRGFSENVYEMLKENKLQSEELHQQ